MYKAYKYRLYPSYNQKCLLQKTFGCCRLVYNIALETKIATYRSNGYNLSSFDLSSQLTDLKKDCEYLKEVDSQALQAELRNLHNAFNGFFRGKGFPKFKSRRGYQSFSCPNNTRKLDFENSLLTIPKIKNIPIKVSRQFEGKIKNITISKTPTGKYFASVLVDDGKSFPKSRETQSLSVGIDVGLKYFAVLSDGTKVDNPKCLQNSLSRLACLQRRMSRKDKGSKNREKARQKVALLHEKIANQRKDFLHKLSTAITKQYDAVCVESLRVDNMLKNRRLSKAVSDVGWGEFFRQLKYKMDWKGGTVLELPTFYPSSKKCSNCGAINESLTLSDREWTCPCGTTHDRDVNAAVNIHKYFTEGYSGRACGGANVGLTYETGRQCFSTLR